MTKRNTIGWIALVLLVAPSLALAEDGLDAATVQFNVNVLWTCLAAFMVFFMQAGFAMVELGFTRAKNAVNILMKNMMDFSVGSLVFFLVGFGLMFGRSNGVFGMSLFAMHGAEGSWPFAFMIFQTVFAATAATIVSGAMAERTKFVGYLLYSFVITLVIYPVFGSWVWGNLFIEGNTAWLADLGFHDFAGSTVVHSVGGWLALTGAIVLGPRIGKYGPDGKPNAIMGHNIPLASLGVFILWFGWFGFNPGSTMVAGGSIGYIAVTTNLSAAAGGVMAMVAAWWVSKKPDASMTLNGALAGLVAVTAGCDVVSPLGAMGIGAVAGVLVVGSVLFIDRTLKIDDPVGAVSVHGVCGAWGTLAVGLLSRDGGFFYTGSFSLVSTQALGVGVAAAWALGMGFLLFGGIHKFIGLRVTPEEELRGLDVGEHGMEAYAGFQIFTTT